MNARDLITAEKIELLDLLTSLTPAEWEHPSLCVGWSVRDVVGHLLYDSVPASTYAATFVRYRGSIDRVNAHFLAVARELSTDQLMATLDSTIRAGSLSRLAPRLVLADVFVHQQDIRRPLGKPRQAVDPDRLQSVLNRPDPFARPGQRMRGLRLVATDITYSKGHGPEVCGPGEALALAVAGRAAALADLDGDGVPILARRIQHGRHK